MTNSRKLVKNNTKCKFRWKKSETSEKSHKNVNKGDKNSQTCKKRHKNVNLHEKIHKLVKKPQK